MPHRRLSILVRRSAVAGAVVLAASGCSDERGAAGPRAPDPPPTEPDLGLDAPVNLTYLCGNRFMITNASRVPIGVTYRVEGSEIEGVADLPAAPRLDPAISERLIEAPAGGTVHLFVGGRFVVARANEEVPCLPPAAGLAVAALTDSDAGQWSAVFQLPIVAVHMVLLPTGRVLMIGRGGTPQVWDPASGTFTPVTPPAWLFCAGHTLLSDGRVFFAGGHIDYDYGLPNTTLFDPGNNGWVSSLEMARGRWYPSTTTLSNGEVLILAGRDQASQQVTAPEIWSNGAIRQLPSALRTLPYYPRTFLTPQGAVFVAGPDVVTQFLTVTGTGKWKTGPAHKFAAMRDYGSAVMYDDGKILYAGGSRTTNTAETIDLNAAAPVWQWTGSMTHARRHLNLTALPTGEVLATGGVAGSGFDDLALGVHQAEMWSPTTGQWRDLASSAVTRGYHATALLLPDGRILHAGSGDGGGAPNQPNAEIYSPPYLFRGERPSITSAPASVRYGSQFRLETAAAGSITKVSLIRLGAVTHAFDQNQRYLRLTFTADGSGLSVTAPTSSNRAPPGHYMVFILNGADVPSVARIIRLY